MQTQTASPASLPFELGEARSLGGLTVLPLCPAAELRVEYVSLDEAAADGLTVPASPSSCLGHRACPRHADSACSGGRSSCKSGGTPRYEVMRVVQRRLFADLGPEEERVAVARGYADIPGRYRRQLADTDEERRDAHAEASGSRIASSRAARSTRSCSTSC
jgi:hypothetical protein